MTKISELYINMTNAIRCEKCYSTFKSKYNLDRHLNKKIPCDTENKKKYMDIKRTCQRCNKILIDPRSLRRHQAVCKQTDDDNVDEFSILKKKVKELETNSHMTINNINNSTNNNTVINQNIFVVPHGTEDITRLDKETLNRIANNGYKNDNLFILSTIEAVHFNEKYPEYQNIIFSDKNKNYCLTYEGENQWVLKETDGEDGAFRQMIYHNQSILENLLHNFNDDTKRKMIMHIDNVDKLGDDTLERLEKETKLLCYNKRHLPIQQRKTLKTR